MSGSEATVVLVIIALMPVTLAFAIRANIRMHRAIARLNALGRDGEG